jgi:hypothetical protein
MSQTDDYLKYAVVATPYVTATSLMYLLGYWGTFHISILSYISLGDILKLALVPTLYIFAMVGVSAFTNIIFDLVISTHGVETPLPRKARILINSFFGLSGVLIFIFVKGPDKWFLGGLVGAILLTRFLSDRELFKQLISRSSLRYTLGFFIIAPLTTAYGFGKLSAQPILAGKAKLIETRLFREYGNEAFAKKYLLEQKKLKFIGIAGDYVFLMTVDNTRVYVVKFSDLHFLEFDPWN